MRVVRQLVVVEESVLKACWVKIVLELAVKRVS